MQNEVGIKYYRILLKSLQCAQFGNFLQLGLC
jgi:hypothetical protein